mmetsp:Transcript_94752/g.216743  ORF Transcript_94752/g.216743 Transcript_94752/m.216743 type:complete len:211 (-) Transcript_94752:334-966(-)
MQERHRFTECPVLHHHGASILSVKAQHLQGPHARAGHLSPPRGLRPNPPQGGRYLIQEWREIAELCHEHLLTLRLIKGHPPHKHVDHCRPGWGWGAHRGRGSYPCLRVVWSSAPASRPCFCTTCIGPISTLGRGAGAWLGAAGVGPTAAVGLGAGAWLGAAGVGPATALGRGSVCVSVAPSRRCSRPSHRAVAGRLATAPGRPRSWTQFQ